MKQRIIVAAAAAACIPMAAEAQVVDADTVEPQAGPAEYFTGTVTVQRLTRPTDPGQAGTAMVRFDAGARSNWHTHPAGQTLWVTKGCGWTQEADAPVQRICAGDAVYVKPGVKHWHGATATDAMDHLAITESKDGNNVIWLEPVTAAEFDGPIE